MLYEARTKHVESLEKMLIDIHMKILLTPDEDRQAELRELYRETNHKLKKQIQWEDALSEPIK